MSKIKKFVLSALLLTSIIILNRFLSIRTPIVGISLQFIPLIMCAIWLGPKYSVVISALSDFIGAILFPVGSYFPGFTLDYAMSGLIYGLFLHNKGEEMNNKKLIINLTISNLIVLIIINVFIASLWIHLLYGKAYIVVLTSRIVSNIIKLPVQIVTIFLIEKFSRPYYDKYLKESK